MSLTKNKQILHVEVRLQSVEGESARDDQVRDEVCKWLSASFLHLTLNQELAGFEYLATGPFIASVRAVEYAGKETTTTHRLQDIQLSVEPYKLYHRSEGGTQFMPGRYEDEDNASLVDLVCLPAVSLVGAWESLVFEDAIPNRLLRYLSRMMLIARHEDINQTIINWNRLVLLHGPPGTGKTTLCRALAHKLSIRLSAQFSKGRLIEINAQCLLSKWFGESGKLVKKMFDEVFDIASEASTLVCILIDEVETLAGSRERAVAGNEAGDSLRATNQLLTALDRLRHQPNVIIFCTSNLIAAVDSAFLDRVDVKQLIPNPTIAAAYEILRSCLNELLRCGIIVAPVPVHVNCFPSLAEVNLHLLDDQIGRTLRRLPFLAVAMYTYLSPCPVQDALDALRSVVYKEAL